MPSEPKSRQKWYLFILALLVWHVIATINSNREAENDLAQMHADAEISKFNAQMQRFRDIIAKYGVDLDKNNQILKGMAYEAHSQPGRIDILTQERYVLIIGTVSKVRSFYLEDDSTTKTHLLVTPVMTDSHQFFILPRFDLFGQGEYWMGKPVGLIVDNYFTKYFFETANTEIFGKSAILVEGETLFEIPLDFTEEYGREYFYHALNKDSAFLRIIERNAYKPRVRQLIAGRKASFYFKPLEDSEEYYAKYFLLPLGAIAVLYVLFCVATLIAAQFRKSDRRTWIVCVLVLGGILCFAWIAWPTLYSYREVEVFKSSTFVRTHRITGKTEALHPSGYWVPIK